MVELIVPPDPQRLLPPILACLPTAFASPRPPPALLSLLSPILRQRIQINSFNPSDNWLRHLCWDRSKSEHLKEQVENATFEPHPVSGEIEVGDVESLKYKRFDEETLRAQFVLAEWPFVPVFLWCNGGDADGWKLTEILPSAQIDETWNSSIQEANDNAKERIVGEALRDADADRSTKNLAIPKNEDDYWDRYDQTPSRTPDRKTSVAADAAQSSDAEYYARYGEVQPAMDNHDPDEEMENGAESTLNGQSLTQMLSGAAEPQPDGGPPPYQDQDPMEEVDGDEKNVEVQQPVPESPPSRGGSDTIARLENAAERFNASEIGIRQHISTSMKSMFRLAKSSGIEREEFERMISRELETLSLLDMED